MSGEQPRLVLRRISSVAVEVDGLLARAVIRQAHLPKQYVKRSAHGYLLPTFCVPALISTARRMGGTATFTAATQLQLGEVDRGA